MGSNVGHNGIYQGVQISGPFSVWPLTTLATPSFEKLAVSLAIPQVASDSDCGCIAAVPPVNVALLLKEVSEQQDAKFEMKFPKCSPKIESCPKSQQILPIISFKYLSSVIPKLHSALLGAWQPPTVSPDQIFSLAKRFFVSRNSIFVNHSFHLPTSFF